MTAPVDRLSTALADRYVIDREIGQGGMATVYLAEDVRHHRKVAIKLLHPELSAMLGPDRFLKEIELTANLQHPHILPLFDSGNADGHLYYVMPYVEGETLRGRLEREQQLPIADALRISTEVADALEYAHKRGVVHRDIKPENILLHDGRPLVADFGIALAVQQAGGTRMTQTGMSLGTPQYMAPEQAMGDKSVDHRADIYALGAITYEMLAGEPPFTGPNSQAIVAKVLTTDPTALTVKRRSIPPHVEEAVLTALEKMPADRFTSAAEFALALRSGEATASSRPVGSRIAVSGARAARGKLVVGMAVIVVLALALAAWGWLRPDPQARTSRFVVQMEGMYEDADAVPTISPDGRKFVYSDEAGLLAIRDEASRDVLAVPGSENSWSPFYAPDGSAIAFIRGFPGDLRVVDLATNAIRTVVPDSAVGYGGGWSGDGWIYFTASHGRKLMRVRSEGGTAEAVLQADSARGDLVFRWPHLLPGDRGLLLTRWRRDGPTEIGYVDIPSGKFRVLANGLRAWFIPSGHLVVVRGDGIASAARFSPKDGTLQGQLVEVERGVRVVAGGTPVFFVSPEGTMVFARAYSASRLVRHGRDGQIAVVDPALTGYFRSPALAPDGLRIALAQAVGGRFEIWVKELDTGPLTRIGSAGTNAYRPFWSPDGRVVGFVSDLHGPPGIFSIPADGSGRLEPIVSHNGSVDEGSWTRDGQWVVFRAGSGSGRAIFGLRRGVDSTPVRLTQTAAEEYSPAVSPDGRWLAYGSDGSGRDEIFIRPFPSTGERRFQVSVAGATEPVWSNSGRELFYRDLAGNLIAVTIAPGSEFRIVSRRVLFSTSRYYQDTRNRAYSVSPDDQSFYFIERGTTPSDGLVVVRNWFEEVMAKVGR